MKHKLTPVQTGLLQTAEDVARMRRALPANHRLQERLAVTATEITTIAREVDQK